MDKSNTVDKQIIENLKRQNEELKYINQEKIEQLNQLDTDQLTGLFAKEAFFKNVRKMLNACPTDKFIFFRFDIDKFQAINTLFGYEEGDRLLQYCASSLQQALNNHPMCVVGRIDADIFCICCKITYDRHIDSIFYADIDNFLKSYRNDYRFTISIGLYYIHDNTESTRSIYSRATLASRKCKGTSDFYLYRYDTEMDKIVLRNQLISSEMHSALENGEFVPFLQPKVDLQTGKLIGAEALVRWLHPKQGLIPPDDFIPLFEQNGFILHLDRSVFKQVCAFIREWLDVGIEPVPISVNLSQFNFTNQNLANEIVSTLNDYEIDKKYIHFEITESAYSMDTKQTLQATKELAAQGLHLEMDDFGTGISSLTMLNELPVKTLKLDLRFIQSRSEVHNNGNILNFVVSLAKQMHMDLIAEGIETEDQLSFLKSIGCNYGQGFLFSKPIPKEEFEKLLISWEILRPSPTETDITSLLDMDDLWFPNSKFNLLFNTLVGGAAIYEFNNVTGIMSVLRINDDYFTALDLSKESHEHYKNDISKCMYPEDIVILKKKIIDSIQNGSLLTAEMRVISFLHPEKITWIKLSARIIVRTKEKTLFLANIENITAAKELTEYLMREEQLHIDYKKQLSIYQNAESNGIVTIRIDNGMSFVYANNGFLKLLECSQKYAFDNADTIMYKTTHPDDLPMVEKTFKSLLIEKANRFELTMRIVTTKENIRSVLVSGLIRYKRDGIYADIISRDITDIESLKNRLQNSENKLMQIVLDSSPSIWDIKTKICKWSNIMQITFNLPPTTENFPDVFAKNKYIRSDSIEILYDVLDRLMHRGENIFVTDIWIKNPAFKQYYRRKLTFAAGRNDANELTCIYTVGFDVGKKIKEEKYFGLHEIIPNMPGYVLILSSNITNLKYANDNYFNLIGYSREEMKKLFHNIPSAIIHPDDLRKNEQQAYETFINTGELHMRGRFRHKDGHELWLRIDGKKIGEEILCILTDDTDMKRTILELETERQFNNTITSLAKDIFFHFDLRNQNIRFSGALAHEYFPNLAYENFPQYLMGSDIGLREELHALVAMIDAMNSGKEIVSEFHFKNKKGEKNCFRLEYRIVFDNKIPVYAIGKLTNIDIEKHLIIKAETDSLTGLYNKETTQLKIQQALDNSSSDMTNALFVIDIDDFKYANDTFGHQYGDELLIQIAATMKKLFRGNDFVGRLGGDEFMIFMNAVSNKVVLKQKADSILSALCTVNIENSSKYLSVSIGIATSPENGNTYNELYCAADIALYTAKKSGKNCFFFYEVGMTMDNLHKKEENDYNAILEHGFDRNIVFKVFEMLQISKDSSVTINEIMSILGTFFVVDRSYIFERKTLSTGQIVYNNTYEWCAKEIKPVIDTLQEIPSETYASVWTQYDSKGIFMCSDITNLEQTSFEVLDSQGIKSILQCIIRQNEEAKLMVGFDACYNNREWTIEEASTLLYITQILGGHLLKNE